MSVLGTCVLMGLGCAGAVALQNGLLALSALVISALLTLTSDKL